MSEQDFDVKNAVSGVLVIDKPVGMTSHDVVQIVRRGTGIRRAGHTGTLDPRASGVLVVLVGPAVRLSEFVSASDKRYQAIIRLGESTDTFDAEGEITRRSPVDISEEQIIEALTQFEGTVEQVPPAYSAKKVQGKKAYELAREGEEVELDAKEIDVYHLELLEWDPPEAIVDVYCSSGTYVRALANDLGEVLGCGGHLVGLRRTKSGEFALRDAIQLRKLQEAFEQGDWYKYLIPAAEALNDWPSRELSFDEVDLVRHGHRIPVEESPDEPDQWVLAVSEQGELVALLEYIPEDKEWQPRKVFFT
ncbi:MAG: tRNA pseudouridine(55) synthase TruB [Brevefilum sp.]